MHPDILLSGKDIEGIFSSSPTIIRVEEKYYYLFKATNISFCAFILHNMYVTVSHGAEKKEPAKRESST